MSEQITENELIRQKNKNALFAKIKFYADTISSVSNQEQHQNSLSFYLFWSAYCIIKLTNYPLNEQEIMKLSKFVQVLTGYTEISICKLGPNPNLNYAISIIINATSKIKSFHKKIEVAVEKCNKQNRYIEDFLNLSNAKSTPDILKELPETLPLPNIAKDFR